jgi:hypothetical protein
MASSGKKKTTMAKLQRESKLRERRAAKQARKDARKLLAENPVAEEEIAVAATGPAAETDGEQSDLTPSAVDAGTDVDFDVARSA